jgi:hypothetical protein
MAQDGWKGDHHQFGDDGEGGGLDHGKSVSFDQFDTTTYLHSDNAADGSFDEHFILQVKGFELNGSPVTLPGFGSHYGMYFLIDATGVGTPTGTTFTSLHVALMVDPGNNDGTPNATEDGIGFANGTCGDFALATGTLYSATLAQNDDPTPQTRHANFVEQMTPTHAGQVILANSLKMDDLMQEVLTTPLDARSTFPVGGGASINLVTGGDATGHVQLMPQTALTIRAGLLSHDLHGVPFCAAQG